ncbi:MAG: hypothetical protein IJ123_10170 [Blautia sp.]|nr:hypothetical protein [Blautia sp.]
MNYKRITLLCGHYGSGKTNLAVNMAINIAKDHEKVVIADLDIVNPYFRTVDSADDLREAGVKLVVSSYANSNVDIPALPQEMYSLVDDRSLTCIVDVGGDDRGAYALGRISGAIREENDYDMFLVVNRYRPLTPDAQSTLEIMHEIETAASLPFTGIINNSNLAAETDAETVLSSMAYASLVSRLSGLPLVMTSVEEKVARLLEGKIDDLFPMHLQKRPV